jgi:hypothetical protein
MALHHGFLRQQGFKDDVLSAFFRAVLVMVATCAVLALPGAVAFLTLLGLLPAQAAAGLLMLLAVALAVCGASYIFILFHLFLGQPGGDEELKESMVFPVVLGCFAALGLLVTNFHVTPAMCGFLSVLAHVLLGALDVHMRPAGWTTSDAIATPVSIVFLAVAVGPPMWFAKRKAKADEEAEQEPEPAEPEPRQEVQAGEPAALTKYLKDCGFCHKCGRVRSSIRAHRSATRKIGHEHKTRKMDPQEREATKKTWMAKHQGTAGETQELVHRERAAAQARERPMAQPATDEDAAYKFDFGKFKGKTFAVVQEHLRREIGTDDGQACFLEYLMVLTSTRWHEKKPAFREALVSEQLWDKVAAKVQRKMARRDLEKQRQAKNKRS